MINDKLQPGAGSQGTAEGPQSGADIPREAVLDHFRYILSQAEYDSRTKSYKGLKEKLREIGQSSGFALPEEIVQERFRSIAVDRGAYHQKVSDYETFLECQAKTSDRYMLDPDDPNRYGIWIDLVEEQVKALEEATGVTPSSETKRILFSDKTFEEQR